MGNQRRTRGQGSLTYVESGNREKRWRVQIKKDGKSHYSFFATKKEAERFLADQKKVKALRDDTKILFKDYAQEYLNGKKHLKPRSYITLEGNIALAMERLPRHYLNQINNKVLQDVIDDLQEKRYSSAVQSKVKSGVIAILRQAASQELISFLPTFDITIKDGRSRDEVESAKNNFLDTEEMRRYEKECLRSKISTDKHTKHFGQKVLINRSARRLLLLLHTGMRVGEALALEWSDWDEDSCTLEINKNVVRIKGGNLTQTPKTDAGKRIIVVNKSACEDIQQLKAEFDAQTEDLKAKMKDALARAKTDTEKKDIRTRYQKYLDNHKFICGATNFPYGQANHNNTRDTHKKIIKAIKPKHKVTIHGLRHSYVTYMFLEKGKDLSRISHDIGHKDVSTTMKIYSHLPALRQKKVSRTAESLEDF